MKNLINYNQSSLDKKQIFLLGNEQLLQKKKVGIFVSRAIPLNIIIPAEKLILTIAELPNIFISGWHSPFERRILKKLLLGEKEVIFFTPKGIKNQSIYSYLKKPLNNGKLLIISLFLDKHEITLKNSIKRNEMITKMAEHNLFVFISKSGNLDKMFSKLSKQKKPLILNHSTNSYFLHKGNAIDIDNFREILL
ncbi:MAG: hypothetical protein KAW92_13670 [Candidatus Cloacimonetes bacterium]|nr:hypothetical protein [Candidatus Cloacimonadota bacterium]